MTKIRAQQPQFGEFGQIWQFWVNLDEFGKFGWLEIRKLGLIPTKIKEIGPITNLILIGKEKEL